METRRTRRPGSEQWPIGWGTWCMAALMPVLGAFLTWLPIKDGHPWWLVLTAVTAGVVVGQLPFLTTVKVVRIPAFFALLIGTMVVTMSRFVPLPESVRMATGFALFFGMAVQLMYRDMVHTIVVRRTSDIHELEPGQRGYLARWDDGWSEVLCKDPETPTLLTALDRLDGRKRTLFEVRRDEAGFGVIMSDPGVAHTRLFDGQRCYTLLTDGPLSDIDAEIREARYGRLEPSAGTTDLATSRVALLTWLQRGIRDPELTWAEVTDQGESLRPERAA